VGGRGERRGVLGGRVGVEGGEGGWGGMGRGGYGGAEMRHYQKSSNYHTEEAKRKRAFLRLSHKKGIARRLLLPWVTGVRNFRSRSSIAFITERERERGKANFSCIERKRIPLPALWGERQIGGN